MKMYIFLLLPLFLSATSLETLVQNAKTNHTSLGVIEKKLSALDDEYQVSRNFTDPTLSINVSDIQFDDVTNRSIEPMQYTSINFKQKFPYFGKRDAASDKVNAKKRKVALSLDELKVKLVETIKIIAYSIWQIEQEIVITKKYIDLTKQNIELYTSYSSSDTSSHMGILSAGLTLSQLKIKNSKLNAKLQGLYKKISYLSALEVNQLEVPISIQKPEKLSTYTDNILQNRSYKVKSASLEITKADIKVKELSSSIDPVVQVGYFHRESFNDYMNIGVAFNLPIYSTQSYQTEASRKLSLATQSELIDLKNLLDAKAVELYAKLQDSYAVYNIIENESLAEIEHMFDLINSSIKSGSDLFVYMELLAKKLTLDEQSIVAVASYHKTLASLDALRGEMK